MIKKIKVKGKIRYQVQSERTHRNMGTYTTMGKAKRRLEQVEYFKHKRK